MAFDGETESRELLRAQTESGCEDLLYFHSPRPPHRSPPRYQTPSGNAIIRETLSRPCAPQFDEDGSL